MQLTAGQIHAYLQFKILIVSFIRKRFTAEKTSRCDDVRPDAAAQTPHFIKRLK